LIVLLIGQVLRDEGRLARLKWCSGLAFANEQPSQLLFRDGSPFDPAVQVLTQ
jgi:hypothetical protein